MAVVTALPGCGSDSDRRQLSNSDAASTAAFGDQKRSVTQSRAAKSHRPINHAKRFVGSEACRTCHAEVSAEYDSHPMAHSMFRTSAGDGLEDIRTSQFSTTPHLSYYAEDKDGQVFHHERRIDEEGNEVYDQAVPVDLTVGSGSRGRSYLTNMDGRLYQSAVSWYADGPKWGLSPGYHPEFHERFERRVTHACLACHAGRSHPHETDTDLFAEPAFFEDAIGCERCHGAGGEHIDFHKALKPTATDATDPIINPDHLPFGQRDAVCTQCHLQGRRRVLQFGRSEFDFRPGMHLSDVWVTILKTQGVESGTADAVSQVEQMYASECYKQSDGQLACTSCHDPHKRPAVEEVASFYRQKCVQCHSSGQTECSVSLDARTQLPESDSCVACHMPTFAAADVHASQTDHRILKRPVRDQGEQEAFSTDLKIFAEPDAPALDQQHIDRAKGIYLAEIAYLNGLSAEAQQALQLLVPVVQANSSDVEAFLSLGKAMVQVGKPEMAVRAWMNVLQQNPRNEEALEAAASLGHQSGQLEQAEQFYKQLLGVNPTRSRYFGRLAHVLCQRGQLQNGIAAAEEALRINPSLAQTHGWLAEAYKAVGNTQKAEEHAQKYELFRSKGSQDANP